MSDSSSFSFQEGSSIRVRSYDPTDEAFVLSLAPRLVIGIPAWRDADKMLATVQRWLTKSIGQHGTETMLFIVEDEQGERLGFASVSHDSHFTGVRQAEIGELAVSEAVEYPLDFPAKGRNNPICILDRNTLHYDRSVKCEAKTARQDIRSTHDYSRQTECAGGSQDNIRGRGYRTSCGWGGHSSLLDACSKRFGLHAF